MVSGVKARGGNYFLYEFRVEDACRDTELDTMMASARSPTIAQTTPPTNTLMAGRWERKYIEMSRIGAPRRRTVVPPSHHSIHSLAGRRFQGCMPKKMTAHNMVTLPDATIRPLPDSGGACQLSHGRLCASVDKISINIKSPVTRLTGSANIGSPFNGPDWETCARPVVDPVSVPGVELSDALPELKDDGGEAEDGGWICSESFIFG